MSKRGYELEIKLQDELIKNVPLINIITEEDIKNNILSFCTGVDFILEYNNKCVYIQCKYKTRASNITEINHFLHSAKCIESKYPNIEHKFIWLCKTLPTREAQNSLIHSNTIIIQNKDMTCLINDVVSYIIEYFKYDKLIQYNNSNKIFLECLGINDIIHPSFEILDKLFSYTYVINDTVKYIINQYVYQENIHDMIEYWCIQITIIVNNFINDYNDYNDNTDPLELTTIEYFYNKISKLYFNVHTQHFQTISV